MGLAGNIKAQAVTQLQTQRLGNALFHTHAVGLFGLPASGHQGVVIRQHRAVRKVDFTVEKAFAPVSFQIIRANDTAIDGHQSAPDHGKPIGRLNTRIFEVRQKGLGLVGLHIDNKAVGRIHRRGLSPARDQVGAQQDQQGQRQQAHRQSTDLHHRKHRTRRHLARSQAQPARGRFIGHRTAQQKQSCRRQCGEHQERHGKTAHRDQAQRQVAADHEQRDGKAEQAHHQHQTRAHLHTAQVPADHAQRWHFGQLQHGRQAKGHQQRQAHGQTHERGL